MGSCSHPEHSIFLSGGLSVFDVVLNRLNTSLLGWWQYEVIITVTLISLGVVVVGLAAKFLLPFLEEKHAHV